MSAPEDRMNEAVDLQGDANGSERLRTAPSSPPCEDSALEPGPDGFDVKARWASLGSRQKLRVKQAAVASAAAALGYLLYAASTGSDGEIAAAPKTSKLEMGAGLRGDSLETKLRGDLKKVLDGQDLLGERITAIEEGKVVPGSRPATDENGGDLPAALPGAAPNLPAPPSDLDSHGSIPPPPLPSPPAAPSAPPAPPVEKTIGAIGAAATTLAPPAGAEAAASPSKKKNRTIYLPPGFMKARLLTGVDALASRDATSNPEPLIARVQAPAVLPNEVKANLAGCFVIGNATGSLAKERVEVQLVSLSCIDFDERSVVDQPIKGFFVDTDGKKGLSGKVVTRAGATLARAFIAGTIAGISQTVESTAGDVSTSALGSVRTLGAGDAAKDVVVVIQEGVALEIKPTAGAKF